jgi:nucleoside-diphosphate-sugar epimerase
MQTVIVTGISSFVGMHLARRFAREGFRVVGTLGRPRATYGGIQSARLHALDGAVTFADLDLTDEAAIERLLATERPSLFVHHAGYAEAYASLDYDEAKGFAINVAPLTHLYRRLSGTGCGVIVTGSGAEYSTSENANREDDPCWPDMPYGLSKLAGTLRARQLAERFGVPTRVARLYIPFGPFDNPGKLLAQVMDGLRGGRPIDLSSCTQMRDFLGVTDLCDAYIALQRDMPRTRFDIFNVCGGTAVKLRDFLLDIAGAMNADLALLKFGARSIRPGEAPVSYGSNEKARRLLAWKPGSLSAAIARDLIDPALKSA